MAIFSTTGFERESERPHAPGSVGNFRHNFFNLTEIICGERFYSGAPSPDAILNPFDHELG
jgi:hypothetical protein